MKKEAVLKRSELKLRKRLHVQYAPECHIPHQNHTPFVERKINPVNFFRIQGMI